MDSKNYIEKIILEEYYSLIIKSFLLSEQQFKTYSTIDVPEDELEKQRQYVDAQKAKRLKITKYVNGEPEDDQDQSNDKSEQDNVSKYENMLGSLTVKPDSESSMKAEVRGFTLNMDTYEKGHEIDGDYHGTKTGLLNFLKPLKSIIKVNSAKRPRVTAQSGNISDHWQGNWAAYGVDFGLRGKKGIHVKDFIIRNEPGDQLFKAIANKLKIDWKQKGKEDDGYLGGVFERTVGNYRVQIIWRDKQHRDHIHIGLKNIRAYNSAAETANRKENLRKAQG